MPHKGAKAEFMIIISPMWFILITMRITLGPIMAKRACAFRPRSTCVLRGCEKLCRCVCGADSNVVASVRRLGKQVRPIGRRARDIVRLANQCHWHSVYWLSQAGHTGKHKS